MENMVVQNAELKRNVQILQQGIVESMKGNKARFMGNTAVGSTKRYYTINYVEYWIVGT